MTEKIKEVKHLQQDGTFKTYPIGADASNIDLENGKTVEAALEDCVKKTDYALPNKDAGIIKVKNNYGINTADDGSLRTNTYSYEDYLKLPADAFVGRKSLDNVITYTVGDISKAIDEINGEVIGEQQ